MASTPNNDVVTIPVTGGGGLALTAVVNAHLALERATRNRRAWMAALALLGGPAAVATAFPGFMTASWRAAVAFLWLATAVAWVISVINEARCYRLIEQGARRAGAAPAPGSDQ